MIRLRAWIDRRIFYERIQTRRTGIVRVKTMGMKRSTIFLMFGTACPTNSEIEYAIFGNNLGCFKS